MNHYVMDYETLSNCFLGVFENYKTDDVHVFTIGLLRNDLPKLITFFENNIKNNEWHISFNGLAFDSQITEYIWLNRKALLRLTGEQAAKRIYQESQEIIRRTNNREFVKYPEYKLSIKQIDLFKLNHWDNPSKSASLKWIQCSMDWHNVLEMPIHHTESITTVEQLKQISRYCRNDVSSTKAIMQKSKKEITLRGNLTDEYKIRLYSASEPRIAKELFLHFLSKKSGIPKYELKNTRTFRSNIIIRDIILPYINFDGVPAFQKLLWNFQNLIVDANNLKGSFKDSVTYRGVTTTFGLGGVHGAKSGIYEADDEMTIMTSDVVSYYPNLAIKNGWSPAHISNKLFCELYEWFFLERRKIPKIDPRNHVYKIILNSTYGLSNAKDCFLYDPEYTMRVTVNGQLSLMMLYTMLVERIPGSVPLMQNTDGVEIMIPRRYKDQYLQICKEWEDLTNLQLEHDEYQKLVIPDVNNYIGIFQFKELSREEWLKEQKESPDNLFKREDGKFYMAKTKCKGRFDFKDLPLHRDKSFQVITKAFYYFFVQNINPEQYIRNCNNIYDFCGQTRCKAGWKFKHTYVNKTKLTEEDLQKTLRYYVSKRGSKILKCNLSDNRQINVVAGKWQQKLFNEYVEMPFEDYDIDIRFYIEKLKQEIENLMPNHFSTQQSFNF